jgi:hypothetical protein
MLEHIGIGRNPRRAPPGPSEGLGAVDSQGRKKRACKSGRNKTRIRHKEIKARHNKIQAWCNKIQICRNEIQIAASRAVQRLSRNSARPIATASPEAGNGGGTATR